MDSVYAKKCYPFNSTITLVEKFQLEAELAQLATRGLTVASL